MLYRYRLTQSERHLPCCMIRRSSMPHLAACLAPPRRSECVPNSSEGRRPEIFRMVAGAAASVPGVTLLNVDPGADTNRTVITFVGEPEAVLEGAFQLVRKGIEAIDMGAHRGAHPRIGSADVVPEYREFERFSTTVLNAYLQPLMDEYLAGLRKKDRHELRRKRRRLEEAGGWTIVESQPDTLASDLESFFELHAKSSRAKEDFLTEEVKTFFRHISFHLQEAGWFSLRSLHFLSLIQL